MGTRKLRLKWQKPDEDPSRIASIRRAVFVRVPSNEWHAAKGGYKREIRSRQSSVTALHGLSLPTPCVAYRLYPQYGYDAALMVLEGAWREPLGAISDESLANEGYATMAEFRRAWVVREKRRFLLLAPVTVHRVRLWTPEDAAAKGRRALTAALRRVPPRPELTRAAARAKTRVQRRWPASDALCARAPCRARARRMFLTN